MGRPPCCDKIGLKKGPWTPEEDLMLVSYVQDHGPGNWRAVPTSTGLMRCSKSCRLRWTNYLRPGIKRGNFTQQEEQLIVHLQALLGNRWAAIASYLPERTDNDIKNYWNTHLNKKLRKIQNGHDGATEAVGARDAATYHSLSKGQWERRLQTDVGTAKQALRRALSFEDSKPCTGTDHSSIYVTTSTSIQTTAATRRSTIYASSTENISRLLEGWTTTKKSFPVVSPAAASNLESTQQSMNYKSGGPAESTSSSELQETYFGTGTTPAIAPGSASLHSGAPRTSIIFPGEVEQSTAPAVAVENLVSLTSSFESWLFDEAIAQLGEASGLEDMALDGPNELFQSD